jgi:hypothetical protein
MFQCRVLRRDHESTHGQSVNSEECLLIQRTVLFRLQPVVHMTTGIDLYIHSIDYFRNDITPFRKPGRGLSLRKRHVIVKALLRKCRSPSRTKRRREKSLFQQKHWTGKLRSRETKKALLGTSLFVISILRNHSKPVKCAVTIPSATRSTSFI